VSSSALDDDVIQSDRPTHRPYARIELERRFLLDALPRTIDLNDYERLHDLYVRGTHLRLRHVHAADGAWITSKLGQKIPNPAAPDDPRQRQMTTIYLPRSEVQAFAALDGLRTTKRRYKIAEQDWTWCIDVWERPARAAGTIVAEVEAPSLPELEALACPAWAIREITEDSRFSAIALAAME
jgi:CYTH domain-containing protein